LKKFTFKNLFKEEGKFMKSIVLAGGTGRKILIEIFNNLVYLLKFNMMSLKGLSK